MGVKLTEGPCKIYFNKVLALRQCVSNNNLR
jgi:hypothetical protein